MFENLYDSLCFQDKSPNQLTARQQQYQDYFHT